MNIKIKLFAAAREMNDTGELTLDVPVGCVVKEMKRRVSDDYPNMSELIMRSAVSLNREFATDESVVCEGDEIALIPPVSGG
ncbi:MAG: MoaD/ThiS family protein [Mariniblastus sp.]